MCPTKYMMDDDITRELFTEKDHFIQFSRTSLQPPREVDNLGNIFIHNHVSAAGILDCLSRTFFRKDNVSGMQLL